MDTKTIDDAIAQLRKQKAHLEQVIDMLELFGSGKRRHGRPPKFLSEALRAAEGARVNKAGAKKPARKRKKPASGEKP